MNIAKNRGFRMALASALIAVVLAFSSFGWSLAIAPNIDLGANQQNFAILGDRDHGYMSEVTGSADFNGDGFGDLLMGAGGYNKNGVYAGAAFVVFGGANLPAAFDMVATKPALTILGAMAKDVFGHAVATGDINGDGNKDIIIGADGYNKGTNRGAVYVYLGGPGKFTSGTVVNLNTGGKVALKILGAADGEHFGRAVAAGDVNGDGKEDIIVGAYEASPGAPARPNAGAIYVILGRGGLDNATPQTIDLSTDLNQAALRIYGATGGAPSIAQAPENGDLAEVNPLMADDIQMPDVDRGDLLGRSLTTADINGDGKVDIIAGAQGANVNGVDTGRTYVFYGKATYAPGETLNLQQNAPTGADVTINGVDAGDQSGFFVGKGKINNDNLVDILISSYLAKGPGNATGAETGEVYVVTNRSPMPAVINLASDQYTTTIYGAKAGDRMGRSLSAGDVNGNGRDELILGASRADALGRQDAGQVYVVYTELNLPKLVYMSNPGLNVVNIFGGHSTGVTCSPDPAVSLSQDCSDEAGHSTSTGDINKDGKADVIVGALYANNGAMKDAGVAYVIYGGNFSLYFPLTRK